jgi:hypothetical protein
MTDERNCLMPYLILIAGLLIGFYALYKFFLTASVGEMKAFFTTGAFVALCLALFFMAITRRLPLALVLLIVTFPFIWKFIRQRLRTDLKEQIPVPPDTLEVLDLKAEREDDPVK